METLTKPAAPNLAVALLALMSLFNFAPVPDGPEGVPVFVARLALVLGGLGLAAALGLWLERLWPKHSWPRQKWASGLAVGVMIVNGLSAAPGLAFAPTMTLRVLAALTVLVSAVVVRLLVRRPIAPTLA